MKTTGVAAIAVMVGGSVWAAAIPAERHITVCMGATPNFALESQAKVVSSGIFAGIGVKILWHSPTDCPSEAILITISNETPAGLLPGTLAYALPYEGTHIVVFFDRLKNKRGNVSCLLGHVIAHEIAHILEGIERHSESGVMKASGLGRTSNK